MVKSLVAKSPGLPTSVVLSGQPPTQRRGKRKGVVTAHGRDSARSELGIGTARHQLRLLRR
jgi:hypothetical protein